MKPKTMLYALVLALALAGPVLGAAGSDTWDNGNNDRQWDEPLNWVGGDIPGDGHTATFDSVVDMPNDNKPGAGTIDFVYSAAITWTIEDSLDGAAIGDVTVEANAAQITTGANVTGNISMSTGVSLLTLSDGTTVAGTASITGAALIIPEGATVVVTGQISLGTLASLQGFGTLDANGGIVATGDCTISFDHAGACQINGWVNADGHNVQWPGTGAITVDVNGTLDLGTGTDNDVAVTVTATTVAVGDSFTCDSFTLNAVGGTLTGGGKTITADDVTWAAGALDAAGTLNVTMTGTGGLSWDSTSAHALGTITFSGTTTAGGNVYCRKMAGDGTVAGGNKALWLYPTAANFWTLSTESDGWNPIRVLAVASRANATLIDAGTSPFEQYFYGTTLTLTGGLSCGTVTLKGSNGAHTLDMAGGDLNCTDFKFDNDDGTFLAGEGNIVITGVIERVAAEHGCSIDFETSHVTLGDDVTLAFAETDGAVDFGSARIDTGAIAINGATAAAISNAGAIVTGRTGAVTLSNLDTNWTAGNPAIFARRWVDGTGNGVRVQTLAPHWLVGVR